MRALDDRGSANPRCFVRSGSQQHSNPLPSVLPPGTSPSPDRPSTLGPNQPVARHRVPRDQRGDAVWVRCRVGSERGQTQLGRLQALYPEIDAGGFSRVDGAIAFYTRVRALLAEAGPDALVVDFGAGRGACLEDPVAFRRDLRVLRTHAGRVVGVDLDPAVLTNRAVDEGHVIIPGARLPLDDESVDLIVSDHTLEHVDDPAWVSGELDRVLRPGGWLCARTPNRWGYIGIGARIVPNRFHVSVLRRLQPTKAVEDTFPTAYRMNTPPDLRRWFPPDRYRHIVWACDNEPAYVGRSQVAARINRAFFSVTPPSLRSILMVFLRKWVPSERAVSVGDHRARLPGSKPDAASSDRGRA